VADPRLASYGLPLPPGGRMAGWRPRSASVLARADVQTTNATGMNRQPTPDPKRRAAPQQPQHAAPMRVVTLAGQWRRTVTLRYRKKSDFYRLRIVEVEPYSVRGPYLYAFCLQHGSIHSFLIANIVSAQQNDRKYVPRWSVEF